jgi:hypothetical protein
VKATITTQSLTAGTVDLVAKVKSSNLHLGTSSSMVAFCGYSLSVYPSDTVKEEYMDMASPLFYIAVSSCSCVRRCSSCTTGWNAAKVVLEHAQNFRFHCLLFPDMARDHLRRESGDGDQAAT